MTSTVTENSFRADAEFLGSYFETHTLRNGEGGRAIVVPALQGRTMTSSAGGDDGQSYGYINYPIFGRGELDPQINLYGGEDRIWISPEGGQFSVFFKPNMSLTFANWHTPAFIDNIPFELVEADDHLIVTRNAAPLMNRSGYTFEIEVERSVELLSRSNAFECLGTSVDGIRLVAHESRNKLTNLGSEKWRKESGLLGLWSLCMSKPSPGATLVIPFRKGDQSQLGTIVTSDYFGELNSSRLAVNESLGAVFLRGDGDYRSKLGLSESRALPLLGSWDSDREVLTIVQFTMPDHAEHGYTNNLWKIQDDPYAGDVINGYNDGPNDSGGKLGGFYELETISPALALAPNESYVHTHRTIRLEGERSKLDAVSRDVFAISLDEIESQLVPLPA